MAQRWKRIAKSADADAAHRAIPGQQAASSLVMHDRPDPVAWNGRGRPRLRACLIVLVILGLLVGLYADILRDLAWQW